MNDNADITIIVPEQLSKDFLGIFALDILHDSKGHGFLKGNKLKKLTDLISESLFLHNDIDFCSNRKEKIKKYVFMQVLEYFLELWHENPSALGLITKPLPNTNIQILQEIVQLPLKSVGFKDDNDSFISLGKNRGGIEVENYHFQKAKLQDQCELVSYISPLELSTTVNYFEQANTIVNNIKLKTQNHSNVVLDMKASAGLIRMITDPLGYITSLPTYADPGYNMAGMSAIRNNSKLSFINNVQDKKYSGSTDFCYIVKLKIPFIQEPLILIKVKYYYGVQVVGFNRENLMINILDEIYQNSLPRSMVMASHLGLYLNPKIQEINIKIIDVFTNLKSMIWNYYDTVCEPLSYTIYINDIYKQLHANELSIYSFSQIATFLSINVEDIFNWCKEENTSLRSSFVISTFKNIVNFNILDTLNDIDKNDSNYILPTEMITTILPELMTKYLQDNSNLKLLAFCYHQLLLLQQYIGTPNNLCNEYQEELDTLLSKQWLLNRKGKLTTQIDKHLQEWIKNQTLKLLTMQNLIETFIQKLLLFSMQKLFTIVDLDDIDSTDPRIIAFLQNIPVFEPTIELKTVLNDLLYFYHPEFYNRYITLESVGLLVALLIDNIIKDKPIIKLSIDLSSILSKNIVPSTAEYNYNDIAVEALKHVIGKFSGDFGQIMWAICNKHIFASEDNNTSAMALLLHRIPTDCISIKNDQVGFIWGNIHGLGDGSSVDIILQKDHNTNVVSAGAI